MSATHSVQPTPEPPDLERVAAEWVVRLRHGLTATEEQEFDGWLQRDPRHADLFAEMNETSQLLDQLRDPALAEYAPASPAVHSFSDEPAGRAAAASSWSGKRLAWLASAGLAAAVALAWLAWPGPSPRSTSSLFVQSATTEIGGLRQLDLPDGSVVQLNTDSAVAVSYTVTERRVRLERGEAFFTVAKNSQRPFWVDVGAISVRAVGTAFNVRYRLETVEVLVKEGKVSVNPAAAGAHAAAAAAPAPALPPPDPPLLVAGEKAVIALPVDAAKPVMPMTVATIAPPRIESTLAWQVGRLEFSDTPLAEVVAEFNRYNRHQLVIADPALEAQTFGGAFARTGYDSLVEVLEQSFDVVAERQAGRTILRKAPASPKAR